MPLNTKQDMRQAVRVVGELHNRIDRHTFHDLTFTCRKFYTLGNAHTTYLHVRHLDVRAGEVLTSAQLQPVFEFLRHMRATRVEDRRHWGLDGRTVRGFRWASDVRERNIFIGVVRKETHLLLLCGSFVDVDRWMRDYLKRCGVPRAYRIAWF